MNGKGYGWMDGSGICNNTNRFSFNLLELLLLLNCKLLQKFFNGMRNQISITVDSYD